MVSRRTNLLNALDERYERMLERPPPIIFNYDTPKEHHHLFPLAEKLLKHYDQGFICPYCNQKMKTKDRKSPYSKSFSIDHIIPLTRGGTHAIQNIHFCCLACNMVKSTMTHEEFKKFIEKEQPDIFRLFWEKEAGFTLTEMSFNYAAYFPTYLRTHHD